MLVIRKEQIETMERAMMQQFVEKTVHFIKDNFQDWSGARSDDDIEEFVVTMITFAQENGLRNEISIQKLIAYKINFQLSIPLTPEMNHILANTELDEDSRLEYFVRQIHNPTQLIKLSLEDTTEIIYE